MHYIRPSVPTGTFCTYKMFQSEHISVFYRNTVEISENSENHLKAIVVGRQMAEVNRVRVRAGKVVEKPQGEEKASKILESSA